MAGLVGVGLCGVVDEIEEMRYGETVVTRILRVGSLGGGIDEDPVGSGGSIGRNVVRRDFGVSPTLFLFMDVVCTFCTVSQGLQTVSGTNSEELTAGTCTV